MYWNAWGAGVHAVSTLVAWVMLRAFAELIYVAIDVERNTRDAAELLQSQPAAKLPPDAHAESSIACDLPEVP